MNERILPRFGQATETWEKTMDRVAGISAAGQTAATRNALARGEFVPGGQIWRGADVPDSILYNCFVTDAGVGEPIPEIAARMSEWTRRGCGVGVNVSAWARADTSLSRPLEVALRTIAVEQEKLWNKGVRRTATMVNFDFDLEGLEAACALISSDALYRHLNIGILMPDAVMRSALGALRRSEISKDLSRLRNLAGIAWTTGNPGFIFIDRVNEDHPFEETINACNPCAEQYLLPDEGCNLGAINLAAFVEKGGFDQDRYREAVEIGIRFLDAVVDVSAFPSAPAKELALSRRRIGLGVMGFASALHAQGIPYETQGAADFAEEAACTLKASAERVSKELAWRHGPFPAWRDSRLAAPRRHCNLLSIAPTGATSLIWGVSSGIEPIYAPIYYAGEHRVEHGAAGAALDSPTPSVEVGWEAHLGSLSLWQKYVDGGISKTVNLPASAVVDDLLAVVISGWERGCKGISLFRDGSRGGALHPTNSSSRS